MSDSDSEIQFNIKHSQAQQMESCHSSDAESVNGAELSQNQLQYSHKAIHAFQIATIIRTRVQSSQKVVDLVALSMCRFLLTYLDLAVNHNGRQSYRSPQRQLSELRNNVC